MRPALGMLALMLVTACSQPELARAPRERMGPPPPLLPLDPLLVVLGPDKEAETELAARGKEQRIRAAGIPSNPIESDPEVDDNLMRRVRALRERALAIPDTAIGPDERAAMQAVGNP